MKVELHILNNEKSSGEKVEEYSPYSRRKSYKTDDNFLDDDIISSPISHKLDRLLLNDIQITSLYQIDKIIKLLENAKPCFK